MFDTNACQGFGASVRRRRRELGHDPRELAAAAGLDVERYHEIEAGEGTAPSLLEVRNLADRLRCVAWIAPVAIGADEFTLTPLDTWTPSGAEERR